MRGWVLAWVVITLAGAAALARLELTELRDAFETDARIMHRLLSQRVVQHDAMLATLALLQPGPDGPADAARAAPARAVPADPRGAAARPRGRLARPGLAAAEVASRTQKRAVLGTWTSPRPLPAGAGRQPTSYALTIDLRAMVPWAEWPMPPATSPVRVTLEHEGQSFVLQPGQPAGGGWRFEFHKHLAADSQPFDVVATQTVGWAALPWGRSCLWALVVAAVLAVLRLACASARRAAAPKSCCAWARWRG